ncbi:hypothetical protein TNCV_736741 [Trichonephila clavipes]|nr:hypothetical protein TNCV_736741 [Trichonephila clavipes]
MSRKQNSNRLYECSQTSGFQQKFFDTNIKIISTEMVACIFGITDHVVTVALEHHRMVNSELCTTIYLPEVIAEIRKKAEKASYSAS